MSLVRHSVPMTTGQFLWGLANGVLVFGVSGAFWVGLGLGPAAYRIGVVPWVMALAVMVGGAALFVRSALRLRRRSGFRRSDLSRADPETRRIIIGFRIVGLIETGLVGIAVLICGLVARPDLIWPAIGVAVSIHFAPLAWLLRVPAYYVTSAAGVLVSVTAIVAPLGPSRLVLLGAGMGVVMWSSAVYLIYRADAIASRALAPCPVP